MVVLCKCDHLVQIAYVNEVLIRNLSCIGIQKRRQSEHNHEWIIGNITVCMK
jgi:hypothetical protein